MRVGPVKSTQFASESTHNCRQESLGRDSPHKHLFHHKHLLHPAVTRDAWVWYVVWQPLPSAMHVWRYSG